MSTNVVIYLGPARSGKTHALVQRYREVLQSSQRPDRALWLAPNAQTADSVRRALLDDGLESVLSPGVATFDQLATLVLSSCSPRWRYINRLQQRELLRQIVRSALANGQLARLAASADRPGFINLLAEHIQELARRNVSPNDYGKARPAWGDAQQHSELALLYEEYIRQLDEQGLYDTDTAHWAVRDVLAAGECQRLINPEIVVADGFTDFTSTQHEILRLLARRAKKMLISLPEDSPPDDSTENGQTDSRPELFAKVTATRAELARHHPKLKVRRLPFRPAAWAAIDHLTRNIFRRPTGFEPPSPEVLDSLDKVEIVEAAGAHEEIVEIARRIKRQLTAVPLPDREGLGEGSNGADQPKSPDDIVVVFRSFAEVAPRVREVFQQFGIPFYVGSEPRLMTTAVVRTLLAVLWLDAEDWPFRRLVSVVTNNSLTALDEGARTAADWLVRDLQIAKGRRAVLERVEQLTAPSAEERGEFAERRAAMARAARPALTQLATAIDGLPEEALPAEWTTALRQLGAALGLSPFDAAIDGSTADAEFSTDIVAWQCIERHFAAFAQLDAFLNETPRAWSRSELIRALVEVASNESLSTLHDAAGRVRILAAPGARHATARHLYLAGMSERAFPLPERAGRLATDAEYEFAARAADQELAAASVERSTRGQDEMLLFYEVLSRAQQSLTISYPALDDKAQTLPPSPYVTEIQRVLGKEGLDKSRKSLPNLSPVPPDGDIGRPADWRIGAIANALDGDRTLLAGIFSQPEVKPLADALDAGLRIVHVRAGGESFGHAEGMLNSPAVAASLARRFGPQHLWSPSQWETYATCPYKFYMQSVLRLEPLADLVLETDYARRGSRVHQVLATFHRQWTEARGQSTEPSPDEETEFVNHLQRVIEERFNATPRAGIDAALLELDARQIRKWGADHFEHHRKYGGAYAQYAGPLTPRYFEFRFGPPRHGDAEQDPDSTADAFVLEIEGERIRITGQIDRIDVGSIDGKTVFNVIDYKSGKKNTLKTEDIESGQRLQLPLYVEAAQSLVFANKAAPLAAGYWSMGGGFDAKGALAVVQEGDDGDRWEKMQATVRSLVRQFVDDIRRGEFPVDSRDDKCTSYCEFKTVCRVSQIRSLNKTRSEEPSTQAEKPQKPPAA